MQKDKLDHFTYWYTGTLTIGLIHVPTAIISMFLLGIIKELWDKYIKKQQFNWFDLLADCIGIGVAIWIIKIMGML